MIKVVIFDYEGVILQRLKVDKEVLKLAKSLRESGLRTAILSNMITPFAWYLKRRGDFKDFDPVLISSDLGTHKPRPKIYEITLGKLGELPENCLFIDNHMRNLVPAQKAGMKVVLAKNTEQIIEDVKRLTGLS